MAAKIDIDGYVQGVLDGKRAFVARAITLVESTRAEHRVLAQQLLSRLLPHAGAARRIGISGVPGVGKSTFIDALGTILTGLGHRVAVLAVDPSSSRTGGSILGDKTRMERLAVDPAAFVRPSPTAGTLGGVAKATRESIVVMEAAGYDVVLVETVGVGQSETAVANMVDTFLLLTLARTGDQLQGIKKGVLELADAIAVNKADGPHERDARSAARELAGALRLMHPADAAWTPRCSRAAHASRPGWTRCGTGWSSTVRSWSPPAGWQPSGATSRWTGPGPWSGTNCWTVCTAIRRCGSSCRSSNSGSGRAR